MAISAETCELDGVTRSAGTTTILDELTLSFGCGVTGLLGPNGAGKTTLLRVLSTATRPTSGDIRVLGLDPAVPAQRTELRRRLGYVPQELAFPRGFTVYGFVEFVAVLKEMSEPAIRRREIRRVLELIDLESVATEKLHRLSGGTRRRVALAQALLGSPDILLLDEPAAGLDPEHRIQLHRVIDALGDHVTVVIATQQTNDVAAWCQRLFVLDHGRLVFGGGTIAEFVALADGRVWIADDVDRRALATASMTDGRHRHVGRPPPGATTAEPTVEDAYLVLLHPEHHSEQPT